MSWTDGSPLSEERQRGRARVWLARRRIQALTAPTATYTAPHDDTWLSAMATAKARGLQAITSMGRWRHRGADQHHDRYRNSR